VGTVINSIGIKSAHRWVDMGHPLVGGTRSSVFQFFNSLNQIDDAGNIVNACSLLNRRLARHLALAIFVCFLAPIQALARPGGGGGFHGGGSGHSTGGHGFSGGGGTPFSGSGGFGGSGADLLGGFLLIFLIIAIGLGYLTIRLRRRSRAQDVEDDQREVDAAGADFETLRLNDPGLTTEGIKQRTRQMANILREAWCAGDMGPARAFVSDGVFSRFTVQLALMEAQGERNVMSEAAVDEVTIVGVRSAGPFDSLHLRIDAHARDSMVPFTASAEQVAKALLQTPVDPYSEIWTLVRCKGVQTKPGAGHVGEHCPSCGAPLGRGEVIKCQYCRALVSSGEYDWVLAEITQLSVWQPTARAWVPGFDLLHAADPGSAVETIEDRASYLFWKWIEACAKGSAAPLRKCATTAFQGDIPPSPALRDVAVGGVAITLCMVAREPNGMDHLEVAVYWSGAPGLLEEVCTQKHILRLARKAGVQTKPSFSSLVCHACGAPLSASDSDECDHCHARVATGEQTWLLDGVLDGVTVG
jgi:hypothetical protein